MTDGLGAALVIGFGGNVGPVRSTFERARVALSALGVWRSAPLYRSAALGPDQSDFLNTAICITCGDAAPSHMLATLHAIEHQFGRDRSREQRWGPRPLDLDVLLWGDRAICTPDLVVPHPRLTQRRFAIEPLGALFGWNLVVCGKSLAELARGVAEQRCELVAESW